MLMGDGHWMGLPALMCCVFPVLMRCCCRWRRYGVYVYDI